MKKWIAILLAMMLLLSFAACGETAETPTPTTEPKVAEPMGTLYVTFGAKLELVYDTEGNALSITGTNEMGKTLAAAKQDQVGKGCVFALRAILRYASDNNLLGDAKSMVIRVGIGEQLPKENFLEEIATDCQYLADEECTGIQMFTAADDKLKEDGKLTPTAARTLACRFMDALEEEVVSDETLTNGAYTFACGDKTVTVDAFSGLVTAK